MKRLYTAIILIITALSGCDFGNAVDPGGYYNPFSYGNRIVYDGYTYRNDYGEADRNLTISFTGLGNVGYIQGAQAYGLLDSTFTYNPNSGQTYLSRLDTLYFTENYNGDIQFLSYGYYRIVPRWIDLFRFSEVNRSYVQNIDENLYGQRWQVNITNYLTQENIYTGFGNIPVYKLEQRLQYRSPFNTDITFYWYWSRDYGLMVYDERRSGLIYQVARYKNY